MFSDNINEFSCIACIVTRKCDQKSENFHIWIQIFQILISKSTMYKNLYVPFFSFQNSHFRIKFNLNSHFQIFLFDPKMGIYRQLLLIFTDSDTDILILLTVNFFFFKYSLYYWYWYFISNLGSIHYVLRIRLRYSTTYSE